MVQASVLYNVARKWMTIVSITLFPILLSLDTILPRLSKLLHRVFAVSGPVISIVVELTPPLIFISAFVSSPLSFTFQPDPPLRTAQVVLTIIYFLHFANRASVFLRSPVRQKQYTPSTIASIVFHALHGWMIGAYLTSPFARIYLNTSFTLSRPSFYLGVILWLSGLLGYNYHAEIISALYLSSEAKDKAEGDDKKNVRQSEAIPNGGLFQYISYPQYLYEWVEWLGFALASAPLPPFSISSVFHWTSLKNVLYDPAYLFAQNLAPPYIFLAAQVLFMLPDAYRGHHQYRKRMGSEYPKERKAIIPYVL